MNIISLQFAKKCISSLIHEEEGALYEFLGLILFLALVLGLLVPLMVEVFIYNNQAQELDTLTKLAANRACSVMSKSTIGVAGDLNQGSLGVGTDVSVMQPLVNAVFRNEAAHPNTYFENTPDGKNIDLKLYDFLGQEIDTLGQSNWVTVNDEKGNASKVLMVGTNTDAALCPAGGGTNWKYCMSENSDAQAKQALINNGQAVNQDLVARMEKMQPGRCQPGQNCSNDFKDRLERCSVCATKSRESIFDRSLFLGSVIFLACKNNPGGVKLLPCKMTACANSKFVQYSAKRGYAPKYRNNLALGHEFMAIENNPNAATEPSKPSSPQQDLFCVMSKNQQGIFEDSLQGVCMQGQAAPPTPTGTSGSTPPSYPINTTSGSSGTNNPSNNNTSTSGSSSNTTSSGTTSGSSSTPVPDPNNISSGGAPNSNGGTTVSNPELDAYNAQKAELGQAYQDAIVAINDAHKQHTADIIAEYSAIGKIGSPAFRADIQQAINEQKVLLEAAEADYNAALKALGPPPTNNSSGGNSTGGTTSSGTTTSGTTTSGTTSSGTTSSGTTTSGTTSSGTTSSGTTTSGTTSSGATSSGTTTSGTTSSGTTSSGTTTSGTTSSGTTSSGTTTSGTTSSGTTSSGGR